MKNLLGGMWGLASRAGGLVVLKEKKGFLDYVALRRHSARNDVR